MKTKVIVFALLIFFASGCTVKKVVQPSGPSAAQQQQQAQKGWSEIK